MNDQIKNNQLKNKKGALKPRSPSRLGLSVLITVLITALVVGGGVYVWERSRINNLKAKHQKKVQELQQKITNLQNQVKELEKSQEKEPYITVVSPTGGEKWKVGKTYNIRWQSSGIDKVDIGLQLFNSKKEIIGPARPIVENIKASKGVYEWSIESGDIGVSPQITTPPKFYKIRISAVNFRKTGVGQDTSDDYFYIGEETARWNTYRNKKFGFELKHPASWDTTPLHKTIVIAPQETINSIERTDEPIGGGTFLTLTIHSYKNKPPVPTSDQYRSVKQQQIEVDEVKGTKYTSTYIKGLPGIKKGSIIHTLIFSLQDHYLKIELLKKELEDTYNQILSTFKFID